MDYLQIMCLVTGTWCLVNGVLHDVFVIKQHKTGYDRELLCLLMDGHVLLTCGAIYLFAYTLQKQGNIIGIYLGIVSAISMLAYCAMIWPFLKSMVTTVLNCALLVLALIHLFS